MLERLFGSKTRVLLLRTFLNNPEKFFFVRELTRLLDLHLTAIRRELENLESLGIIQTSTKADLEREAEKELRDNKKYHKLNANFSFLDELRALMVKAQLMLEESFMEKLAKLGNVSYCLLSGVFVGRSDSPVDILLVGKVNRPRFLRLIKPFERELGRPLNYTILSDADFRYRRDVTDRFLYDLLEHKHLILVDSFKDHVPPRVLPVIERV